jgi:hypothetical protein
MSALGQSPRRSSDDDVSCAETLILGCERALGRVPTATSSCARARERGERTHSTECMRLFPSPALAAGSFTLMRACTTCAERERTHCERHAHAVGSFTLSARRLKAECETVKEPACSAAGAFTRSRELLRVSGCACGCGCARTLHSRPAAGGRAGRSVALLSVKEPTAFAHCGFFHARHHMRARGVKEPTSGSRRSAVGSFTPMQRCAC